MKKSGYRTIFHIYLIFFIALLGTILAGISIFLLLVSVRTPKGETVRTDWPESFTKSLGDQILFANGNPGLSQSGVDQLRENQIGIQILDHTGKELYAFQKPENANDFYSNTDLLRLNQTGDLDTDEGTSFVGKTAYQGNDYAYVVHFPVKIRKITMYLNGERFTGGKTVIYSTALILLFVVMAGGILYGFWTAKVIKRLTTSIQDISKRCYLPLDNQGAFGGLYDSLNRLDLDIKASDQLREKTETMRKEWLANITHDLKTPLSPIKGYAEMLQEDTQRTGEQNQRYARVILRNATFMEQLIEDLKLTYQLESNMLPMKRREQNLVRFLKELVIDLLNRPEYESRRIDFDTTADPIPLSFDRKLFTRAFQNLIINAFVHGGESTEVTIQTNVSHDNVQISLTDNGKGMAQEDTGRLFDRYYRGTDAGMKPEGTGLGLAIVKNIVEAHDGEISVSSVPGLGTTFQIVFPLLKVN